MSIPISRSILNNEEKTFIHQLLTITPEKKFTTDYESVEPVPFAFYVPTKEFVYLPYYFGRKKFPETPFPSYETREFNFTGTLFPYQIDLVHEAQEQLREYGTTLLAIYTGGGKTILSVYLASCLKLLTLIIVHRRTLVEQWKETLDKATDSKVFIVGTGNEEINEDISVIISMDTRFKKIPEGVRKKIGLVILDEAHLLCTPKRVSMLLGTQPRYIIGATATPFREDNLFIMMKALLGNHQVQKLLEKEFKLIRVLTGITPELRQNRQGHLDWAHFVTSLGHSDERNEILYSLLEEHSKDKVMILSWQVNHCHILHQELQKRGKSSALFINNVIKYHDASILIATFSKGGVGFDQSSLAQNFDGHRINVLILMGTTKSQNLIQQVFGRAFRAPQDISIYVFIDEVGVAKSHWGIMKKWALSRDALIETRDYRQPKRSRQRDIIRQQINHLNLDPTKSPEVDNKTEGTILDP